MLLGVFQSCTPALCYPCDALSFLGELGKVDTNTIAHPSLLSAMIVSGSGAIRRGGNPRAASSAPRFLFGRFLSQRIGVGSGFPSACDNYPKIGNGDLQMDTDPLQSTVIINCKDDSVLGDGY